MKINIKLALVGAFCCLFTGLADAQLLGVNPSYPQINFVSVDPDAVSYDTNTDILTIAASPINIFSSESDTGTGFTTNQVLQLEVQVNPDGSLGTETNSFTVTGTLTWGPNGVTNTYSGTLLQGTVTAVGSVDNGNGVNQFDFTVQLTGGSLKSFFDCADLFGITMSSEESSFMGGFTNDFDGLAKGYCGPDSLTPPTITCPPLSEVVTTPTTEDGTNGYIVTYPNPVVTDVCDPEPTIYCDTPSGSFVALSAGQTLTINCYGIDVANNYSICSFTVTMGGGGNPMGGGACPVGFSETSCAPVTLTNTPGLCSALYTFSAPIATNCMGMPVTATATAVNEAGVAITLTNLGSGLFEGIFPRTKTTNGNVITFTASQGSGSSAVQECKVFVKDTQPPEIMCLNQTATFKPILTNALSCNQMSFSSTCITASNYLWFSSVLQPNSCRAPNNTFNVHIFDQTICLSIDNSNVTLTVPDAYVHFSNGVCTATTAFTNGAWVTCGNTKFQGNTFACGIPWQLPYNLNNPVGGVWGGAPCSGQLRRHVNSATWCARFGVDSTAVALSWQCSGVVHSKLSTNYNALCVKPTDDCQASCWNIGDPAGSCENYKSYLTLGACGRGYYSGNCYGYGNCQNIPDCTGILSPQASCNLGLGIVCEGAVNFTPPIAVDNCDSTVTVTCNPPSGSVFGPGNYTINCTAVDSSGNSNQCSFVLTVLAPLQVVFDSPSCDNVADNTCEPDAGYTDFNCPDSPTAPQYITCFTPGQTVCHQVRLLDCNGNDVTTNVASCVTVHIDCAERKGSYTNSVFICQVPSNYVGIGCPGGIMVPCGHDFQYNLNTSSCQPAPNSSYFYRSCVWVDYNSSPGVAVGMEDVLLQCNR